MVSALSHGIPRVPWYSGSCWLSTIFVYGTITLFGDSFQSSSTNLQDTVRSPNPNMHARWFGLLRFRSPLLTKSIFFLFLRLLRCFSSAGSLHNTTYLCYDTSALHLWVSPFRYLWIISHLPIPIAFRSLLRLSSALSA